MKWILLFFAFWNIAGALLRMFRILFERLPLTRRFYPDRDLRRLDDVGDLELNPVLKARYRAAAEKLSRMAGIPLPGLFCSMKPAMVAGTRGWMRHELHVSRGILTQASDKELLAILAHELGHIYYRHFATLRMAELFAAMVYARVVFALWETSSAWYVYLLLWSLLDFSYSMFRLAAGSVTELMADHFAAHKLNLAEELSQGLMRAQCFNGASEFKQIVSFYPTVKLRVRLLSHYARALAAGSLAYR